MDRELLDKEVLCLLDTRQIQSYIFQSGTQLNAMGASDLILHILSDAILFALKNIDPALQETEYDLSSDADARLPWFDDPGIQFQLIYCMSGNAMFLARTGALAAKVIRKVSRYYLEHGYSLNLSAACVEKTDNIGDDISGLYRSLEMSKSSAETLIPLATLPVCIREAGTGFPVVAYDEISSDPVSASSILKRQEARKRAQLVAREDIHTTTASNGKAYMAVIHSDGNNIGITIGKILQAVPDYEAGIRTRRRISQGLEATISGVIRKTIQDLEHYYREITGKTEDYDKEFVILQRGGDDINCMCNAVWAFPFMQFFNHNLKDAYICRSDSMTVPLHVCGGIAFVTEKISFQRAFSLAQECCSSAKTAAKMECNLRGGLAGTWVDFQVLDTPNTQDLEMLREKSYVNVRQVSLLLRPYCMDPEAEGQEFSYQRLVERVRAFRSLHLSPGRQELFRQLYLMERGEFNHFLEQMKRKGYDLTARLGAPIYRDRSRKPYGTWFDAAEVADFFPEEADQ